MNDNTDKEQKLEKYEEKPSKTYKAAEYHKPPDIDDNPPPPIPHSDKEEEEEDDN